MNLDQNAKVLEKGEFETTGNIGTGLEFCYYYRHYTYYYSKPEHVNSGYFLLNLGFQQRFPLINKKMELQIELETNNHINLIPTGATPFYMNYIFLDVGTKFSIFSNEVWDIAITPYLGQYFIYHSMFSYYFGMASLGMLANLKFIVSFNKTDYFSLFWGFSTQINKRFYNFVNEALVDLFEIDAGISFGWEVKKYMIQRHEFCLNSYIDISNRDYDSADLKLSLLTISLTYNLSLGNRFFIKKNEK